MTRLRCALLALLALSALELTPPAPATGQGRPDPWAPQTVPLLGASYSPDIGLLIGAGVVHTRYGFRALPPSTRLFAEAAYATGARSYRVDVAGEFRQPLAPRLRLSAGPLLQYTQTRSHPGTLLTTTGPYYGGGDFGEVGTRVV